MGAALWTVLTGLFVFAYNILGERAPLAYEQLFTFRERLYGFVAVRLMDYAGHARPISPKWDTLAMPAASFRRHARPLDEILGTVERGDKIRLKITAFRVSHPLLQYCRPLENNKSLRIATLTITEETDMKRPACSAVPFGSHRRLRR